MADATVVYDLVAHDRASSKIDKVRARTKLLAVAAGALALKFGVDSVKEFAAAQEAQKRLSDAFSRFPKLADTNIDRLRALNSTLQKKTKYDDDALASGQAVLAQFGVTGKQLESITPLLADYASRTGKDIPSSAQDVGKALLGNAKALKNIGIKYTATGNTAKDFANIQALLRKQVGGFAEKEGQTAAGQAAILKNQFGEVEEQVGAKLLPALMKLAGVLLVVIGFIQKYGDVLGPVVGILGGFIGTLMGVAKGVAILNAGLKMMGLSSTIALGPIGLIIAAVVAVGIALVILYKKSSTFRAIVNGAFNAVWGVTKAVFGWIKDHWPLLAAILFGPFGIAAGIIVKHWDAIKSAGKGAILFTLGMIDKFLGGMETLIGFMGKIPGPMGAPFRAAAGAIQGVREKIWALQGDLRGIKSPPPIHITADARDAINDIADLQYRLNHVPRQVTVGFQSKMFGFPGKAAGGPVQAGRTYIVGERQPELFTPNVNGTVSTRASSGGGWSRADLDYLADRLASVMLAGMSAALIGTARRGDLLARGG